MFKHAKLWDGPSDVISAPRAKKPPKYEWHSSNRFSCYALLHHWVHGCSWLCALLRFLWSQQHVNSLIQSHTVWVAGDQRTNGMRIRHLELPINNEKHLVWLESLSLVGWKRRKHGERASTADKLGGSILEAVHWLPSLAEHFQPGTTRHSWRNSEINKYLSYCHIVSYDLPSFS